MTEHDLKTWPDFFDAVRDGRKTFEVRRNDRGFQTGDILVLHKWDPGTTPTGTVIGYLDSLPIRVRVCYVLNGFGISDGFVAMAIERVDAPEVPA